MGLLGQLFDSLLNNSNTIDPFAAAGIAYGLKGDKLTNDEMAVLGTTLGASGAFDDDTTNSSNKN